MAPRGPAKAREYDYSNVGKAGRRTGITLKEGKRDEHGMEEIEGMWSSPEKSSPSEDRLSIRNEYSIGSDGMSMDEGNAPGPADFLDGPNSRRDTYAPSPVVQSSMKTGLLGSSRKTAGPQSSQSPQRHLPPSSPSDGKGLGSTKADLRHDVSPLTSRSINAPSLNALISARKGSRKEPPPTTTFSDSDVNSQLDGDENADVFDQMRDDFVNDDDPNDAILGNEAVDSVLNDDSGHKEFDSHQGKSPPKTRKRTRGRTSGTEYKSEERQPATKRKRPGRPPKTQEKADEGMDEQRPSKKPKFSGRPSREMNPSGNPELDKVVENYVKRTGPLKGRSLYILKREAPTDSSTTHTRSGRASVRPLAYWRNERCVYGDGEVAEGQRYPLSTIKEVIRTEELEPEKPKKGRTSKKSKAKKDKDDFDGDDGYADGWEKEAGILYGYIRKWDAESQTAAGDDEVVDIAYAPGGIETRNVKGSTFRFAKLLSSPFLGSGIVELPPGGVKKPKNSKKMHMVFYVVDGRVQIDVSGVQFSAGKGCVFQVPRGNYYSFANTHRRDARLFFTQTCVPGSEGSTMDSTKPASLDDDAMVTSDRPPTAGKGRPKGKQKASSGKAGGSKSK